MLTFKRFSNIIIPKIYENENWYMNVIETLKRIRKDYHNEEEGECVFFVEDSNNIYIPRYFPIDSFVECNIEDVSFEGKDINLNHSITPKNGLQKLIMAQFKRRLNGLIQLEPGTGKTVISVYLMSEFKKKSFILVHRDSLSDQWKQSFLKFTDIKEDRIAILSSKTFVQDLQKDIIICTTQTFLSLLKRKNNEFIKELYASEIGVFFGDEVHTSIGAPTFSLCSMFIPSRRNFGLSATPSRFDRNEDIIFFHVGEVFSNEDAGDTVPANVTVLIVDSELKSSKTDNFICCFGKGFEKSRYLNMLKNSKIFMKTTEMVLNKVDSEGYKIVFVSERIEKFLKLFYDKILHDDKSMFIAGSGNEVLKKRITFTTPGKMRDGVDIPEKNCLIMTSPIGNISQMCGRVVRGSPGKSSAIIIDIVDISYSNEIANSYMNRKIYYNKKEWRIQYVYVSPSGKPIPINELKALNLILNGIHAEDSLSES